VKVRLSRKKRLKKIVVTAVDHRHVDFFVAQLPRAGQAGKACANDDDVLPIFNP
jgi:hypothetical protein